MPQVFLNTRHAHLRFGANGAIWFLASPLVVSHPDYQLMVRVAHASVPLTFYAVNNSNRRLQVVHAGDAGEADSIDLPEGNHGVDFLVPWINQQLSAGVFATYSEATNKLTLTSANGQDFAIGPETTAGEVLGCRVGDASALGVYECPASLNLAGTTALFLRGSISTSLIDPITLATGNVLAKVDLSRQPYEIETYAGGLEFPIADRVLSSVSLYLEDDFGEQVDLHGAHYSATLEFRIAKREAVPMARDYRLTLYQTESGPQPEEETDGAQPARDPRGPGGP